MRAALRPVGLAIALLATVPTGCETHLVGPELTFVVESEALVPSSTLPAASTLCCCHVKGTVRNTSSIAIHVNLNFEGLDAGGASLGTALDFVPNVAPGERKPYEAVGINAPCASVATLRRAHIVTGVYTGP